MRLLLFPGVGADARLFAPQAAEFPELVVPAFLPPVDGESLRSYAARFSAQLHGTGPLVLGGNSFGGMLACELAAHLKPDVLVLVGSARSPADFPWPVRVAAPLARFVPDVVYAALRPSGGLLAWPFGARRDEDKQAFGAMLDAQPASFIGWACRAIASWTPPDLSGIDVRVLHGSKDLILWPPAHARLVEGAGHLLTMTHAVEVNAFLREAMRDAERGASRAA